MQHYLCLNNTGWTITTWILLITVLLRVERKRKRSCFWVCTSPLESQSGEETVARCTPCTCCHNLQVRHTVVCKCQVTCCKHCHVCTIMQGPIRSDMTQIIPGFYGLVSKPSLSVYNVRFTNPRHTINLWLFNIPDKKRAIAVTFSSSLELIIA